jgi:signal transduction histidine kinase
MSEARLARVGAARFGPPIAVQLIALLVGVLIVGQLTAFLVVTLLPPPRPPIYRVEEIATALKGVAMTPRYAPPLIRSVEAAPPKPPPGREFRTMGLRSELARLLGAPIDDVVLIVEPHPRFAALFGPGGRRRLPDGDRAPPGPPPLGPPPLGPPPPEPPPPYEGPTSAASGPGVSSPGLSPSATRQGDDGPSPWPRRGFRHGGWFARQPWDREGFVVGEIEAAYQAQPGKWTVVRSQNQGFPNPWQRRLLLWFMACLVLLTPVGYLFARRLTAPIVRFAAAADRLGRGLRSTPLTLRGPAEIGVAAMAFNEMQTRLARYVEDRTAMIGAIAHDLRTPLARVQFKLQRAPEDLAADIRSDLGQMEAMIAAVLAFVRDAAPAHERERLDLLSVLEVVADDASATSADVEVEGVAVIVDGDASALQRLFVNLVDNAVKYGGRARIRIAAEDGDALVTVKDEGPGLPEEELNRVFEPFYRVEGSRSRETGGIGLGLSVARSIARAHGGDVTLSSDGGGLTAVVRLPGAVEARA